MNILERYFYHEQRGEYSEALPIIEYLTKLHPEIATNWYNYGHCLEMLNRNREAATAFLKVVELEPEDGGAYLRACLALDNAGDIPGLLQVFRRICMADPSLLPEIQAQAEFAPYFRRPEFKNLLEEFHVQ